MLKPLEVYLIFMSCPMKELSCSPRLPWAFPKAFREELGPHEGFVGPTRRPYGLVRGAYDF